MYYFAAVFQALACAGAIFGFASMAPVLTAVGAFAELCPGGIGGCAAQTLALNQVYNVAAVTSFASPVPVGIFLDRFGPRLTTLLCIAIFTLGPVLVIVANVVGVSNVYYGAFICFGFSASSMLMPLYHCGNLFAGREGLAVALLNGSFDAGSLVFMVMGYMHAAGVSLTTIMVAYLCGPVLVVWALAIFVWRDVPFAMAAVVAAPSTLTLAEDTRGGVGTSGRKSLSTTPMPIVLHIDVEAAGASAESRDHIRWEGRGEGGGGDGGAAATTSLSATVGHDGCGGGSDDHPFSDGVDADADAAAAVVGPSTPLMSGSRSRPAARSYGGSGGHGSASGASPHGGVEGGAFSLSPPARASASSPRTMMMSTTGAAPAVATTASALCRVSPSSSRPGAPAHSSRGGGGGDDGATTPSSTLALMAGEGTPTPTPTLPATSQRAAAGASAPSVRWADSSTPQPSSSASTSVAASTTPNGDVTPAVTPNGVEGSSQLLSRRTLSKRPPPPFDSAKLAPLSFRRQLLSREWLTFMAFFSVCILRFNFFIGTVDTQMTALGQVNGQYTASEWRRGELGKWGQ